jgi:hypothetical protein
MRGPLSLTVRTPGTARTLSWISIDKLLPHFDNAVVIERSSSHSQGQETPMPSRPLQKSVQSRHHRKTAYVSAALDRHLAAYALAAGAAGVSIVALGQAPPEETIVYTPANLGFIGNRSYQPPINIDLNHDGITDITIWASGSGFSLGTLNSSYYQGVAGWTAPEGNGVAFRPLTKGVEIGPTRSFQDAGLLLKSEHVHRGHRTNENGCEGNFKNVTSAYLGVRFSISGATHYGWIQISTSCGFGSGFVEGTITGYAYNTAANAPLNAGQTQPDKGANQKPAIPGSLALLSIGSVGLPLWRP